MSNHLVPATAGGMPAPNHLLLTGAVTAPAVEPDACAALLASIPSWMALKIEVHRDAAAELAWRTDELDGMVAVSPSLDRDHAPTWFLKAERQRDAAERKAANALAALLAERPRSLKDAQERARYLVAIGARLDGPQAASLLVSMTGGEA